MAPDSAVEPAAGARHLTILDLPLEIQKGIFGHCGNAELICLALVCRHFRELSAANLYRKFHIVFADDDDPVNGAPVDGLASGLDTFATGEYNYAKHLRDISLDTLSAGNKAEIAYKSYLYGTSCGKFMNTLLHLTLQRAKYLETFRWNIRVELSRPVYRALHQIHTLSHVHIRLQAGKSLYQPMPPLPNSASSPIISPVNNQPSHVSGPGLFSPPPLDLADLSVVGVLAGPFYMPPPVTVLPPPPPPPPPPVAKSSARPKAPNNLPGSKEPPTLSGFKKLKSLSVLDMDNLDMITELKTCIRNSASTLTRLKLSFSEGLAMRARKPPPNVDPDDSEDEDFTPVSPAAPPRQTEEERKRQEAVLGRIFDVEPYLVKRSKRPLERKDDIATGDTSTKPGEKFISAIRAVSDKLIKDLNGEGDLSATQQDILNIIETAARKYVASEEAKSDAKTKGEGENSCSASSSGQPETTVKQSEPGEVQQSSSSSLFENKTANAKGGKKDVSPEDIDIEEPEGVLDDLQEGWPAETDDAPTSPLPQQSTAQLNGSRPSGTSTSSNVGLNVAKATANLAAQRENFKALAEKLEFFEVQTNQLNKEIQQLPDNGSSSAVGLVEEAERQMRIFGQSIKEIQQEMAVVAAEIDDAEKLVPDPLAADDADLHSQRVDEYIRSTRGIGIQNLSICLIPVKASVLSRAIDIRVLKKLTLLNVGAQAPIWALLAKENKIEPIALRNVYTDNVCTAFLTLMSQLEELHEFFILERSEKSLPGSFAPRTTVKIDQIRRSVLKKHISTLERVMIKNSQDTSWDMDGKTMLLICRHARALKELAVSMGIRVVHTTLQNLGGLVSLRALHIINLRNDDTCVWVMRETRRFLVDTLTHCPDLKLEWIAIDDNQRVDHIIRRANRPKKNNNKKNKGKAKVVQSSNAAANDAQFPILPLVESWEPGSESDGDESDEDAGPATIETFDQLPFYEVEHVRIFKKGVVSGGL